MWDDREKIVQAHVDVPGDQQAAARGRAVVVQQPLGPLPRRRRGPEHRLDHRASTGTGVPVPFFTYRSTANPLGNDQQHNVWRASMPRYVTGCAQLEGRISGCLPGAEAVQRSATRTMISYTFFGGAPLPLTQYIPSQFSNRTRFDAFYVQDQWTVESPDGAGRASLRARVELVSRR